MTFSKNRKAFTLMEVLIAIIIIGILATLAGPQILKLRERIRVNSTKGTMAAIKSALQDYNEDMGRFPGRREGDLDALVQRPAGKEAERWDGPYLEGKDEIPLDAWSREFEYNLPPNIQHKNKYKYFEIISTGKNGPDDEKDNIDMGA
jgi:general secretion pathway protein G